MNIRLQDFCVKKIIILLWLFIVLQVSCKNNFKVQNASLEMLHELEAAAVSTYKVDPRCIRYETSRIF